jgi:hypothetical protein
VAAVDANAAEEGADPGTFRITRSGDLALPLTVHYLLGGTTVNGLDYLQLPTSATIPAGAESIDVTVIPILDGDTPPEWLDVVLLQLIGPPASEPGYTIGSARTAAVTIVESAVEPGTFVQLLSPLDGETFEAGSKVRLKALITGGVGDVLVEFYAGSRKLGSRVVEATDDDEAEPAENKSAADPDDPESDDEPDDDPSEDDCEEGLIQAALVWRDVPAGNHILVVFATDEAGTFGASETIIIHVLTPENRPPSVRLTKPEGGERFYEGRRIGIRVRAKDDDGAIAKVEIFAGTQSLGLAQPTSDDPKPRGGNFALAWSGAPVGDHVLTAVATDDTGASTTSAPVPIVVRARKAPKNPEGASADPSDDVPDRIAMPEVTPTAGH